MNLVRFYVHRNCLTDGPDLRPPRRFPWEPPRSSGYSDLQSHGLGLSSKLLVELALLPSP